MIGELTTLEASAKDVTVTIREEKGIDIDYRFGTMIEIPRAALTTAELAAKAEFFALETNDATPMTCPLRESRQAQSALRLAMTPQVSYTV